MSQRAVATIVVKGWSGWTKEQPEAKSRQLEVAPGDKLTPATIGIESAGYEITVDSVGSDRIMVTYSGVVMQNADGTINLAAPRKGRCMIQVQHCMRLATATMDAGTSIALSLDRIVE
jgi:hypothetical protein